MRDFGYSVEINLTKSKWTPTQVEEIPDLISRAFETHVSLKEIQPLIGTDHVEKWPIRENKDIGIFMEAKSKLNEAFAEKVIKINVPRGLVPTAWRPKKVKILAKGTRIAKYFGEDQVGERQVEVSLKLFDCGHFYLKQTLPGTGASPYQIIYEGTWNETGKGFWLKYLLRYTGQTSKKSDLDLAIQALPPNQECILAQSDESELKNQLNGLVPAIVGEHQFCRVEIYREPDIVEKAPLRFNEDCPDPPSWTDPTPTGFKKKEEQKEKKKKEEKPVQRSCSPERVAAKAPSECMKTSTTTEHQQPHKPTTATGSSAEQWDYTNQHCIQGKDEEPMWPLMLGLSIFVLILAVFGWHTWLERSMSEPEVVEDLL